MKYKTMKVITTREIERTVSLHYDITIKDLASLMCPEDFMNDCYKTLYFGQDAIIETEEEIAENYNVKENKKRLLVYSVLQDYFPDDEAVLVDVSW